jgi:alpha-D-ribose 1-methylphosphonate 5-triphosphate diphosphatase
MSTRTILIRGGTALIAGHLRREDIAVVGDPGHRHLTVSPHGDARIVLDARDLLVLPGLVDIHGDAFERQIMPRPGVMFDVDLALADTDRQLLTNGITTAMHGLTWSWEPGFRGADQARAVVSALERLRPTLAADARIHLRHEIFNLASEGEIIDWLRAGRIALLAFNDHMTGTLTTRHRPDKRAEMMRRTGLGEAAFTALVDQVAGRAAEVPASVARLAAVAREVGVPMLSHDDLTADARANNRALGMRIAEFPVTTAVAEAARAGGDTIVFGAPNVVRGGSHTGCPDAADMVVRGLCDVLASDYYYPALLQAPFVLRARCGRPLEETWPLVSRGPAVAAGLTDRGEIAERARADVILVEHRPGAPARCIATIADGRIAALADADRLSTLRPAR